MIAIWMLFGVAEAEQRHRMVVVVVVAAAAAAAYAIFSQVVLVEHRSHDNRVYEVQDYSLAISSFQPD